VVVAVVTACIKPVVPAATMGVVHGNFLCIIRHLVSGDSMLSRQAATVVRVTATEKVGAFSLKA
jgi:hypothetical protein